MLLFHLVNRIWSLIGSYTFSFVLLFYQAGKLNTYRFCDNVWTLLLTGVEFKEVQDVAKADRMKIVAMDGRGK